MTMRNAHSALMMTCALAAAGAGMSAATAVAQEAVLPPVVVEGATLEAKPKAKVQRTNEAPPPSAAGSDEAAVASPPAEAANGEVVGSATTDGEGSDDADDVRRARCDRYWRLSEGTFLLVL